jgi:hypothetical protein
MLPSDFVGLMRGHPLRRCWQLGPSAIPQAASIKGGGIQDNGEFGSASNGMPTRSPWGQTDKLASFT